MITPGLLSQIRSCVPALPGCSFSSWIPTPVPTIGVCGRLVDISGYLCSWIRLEECLVYSNTVMFNQEQAGDEEQLPEAPGIGLMIRYQRGWGGGGFQTPGGLPTARF